MEDDELAPPTVISAFADEVFALAKKAEMLGFAFVYCFGAYDPKSEDTDICCGWSEPLYSALGLAQHLRESIQGR